MNVHINAKQFVAFISLISFLFIHYASSDDARYPCPDCHKYLTDPVSLIRHRTMVHGHDPRHMLNHLLKEAEKNRGEATRDQQAASVVPHSTQNASSSTPQGVQISPVAVAQWRTASGHMVPAPVVALDFCPFAAASSASRGQST